MNAFLRALLVVSLVSFGCGPSGGEDAGADAGSDAGLQGDAGADAGQHGGTDAGAMDAGRPDAGSADAGRSVFVGARFPNAMTRTNNLLLIRVSDAADAGIADTLPVVSLFMPAHGHGGPAPSVTSLDGGDFSSSVGFIMPGEWEVTVSATARGETASTKLTVQVP